MRENGGIPRRRLHGRNLRGARWLGALIVAVAVSVVTPSVALAEYSFKGTFAGPGTGAGDGELSTPGRAAVEASTGNLFVVDAGNSRVQVFKTTPAGTAEYLTQFGGGELSEPWGIALAEEGGQTFVYVADGGNSRIVKYESNGAANPTFGVDPGFTSPVAGTAAGEVGDFHAALAVDPANGDLLVADNANKLIDRYEADGTFVSSFDGTEGGSALEGPIDLAVNSGGDIYVVDANGEIAEAQGTSKVLRYHSGGEFVATLGPVGTHQRPATVAVNPFNDEVVVSGDQDSVYEAGPPPFVPVLQTFDSSNQPLGSPAISTQALYDTVSGLAIASGSADRLYVVLDVGRYFGSPYGSPQIQAFRQPHPVAPTILGQGAAPTASEATLTGAIDTGEDATQYHFEWGPTTAYGNTTPLKNIPASATTSHVSALLSGLTSGSTYHYRLVASNSKGTDIGPDRTFTTNGPAAAETCANAAIRKAEQATELPECRAYEMASPVDKNGNEVTGFFSVQAAPSGDRVAYGSTGAFPMSESALPESTYLSIRGDGNWNTRALSPPQKNDAEIIGGVSRDFSDDLGKGLTFSRLALAPGAVDGASNMYLQDNLTGALSYIGGLPGSAFFNTASNTGGSPIKGRSENYEHVALEASQALVPGAPEGIRSVYEVTPNGTRLASILPNGLPATENATVGGDGAGSASTRPVSEDGRRIFFEDSGRLYVRIDGAETVELSASQVPGEEGRPGARFGAANLDGTVAFFTARASLAQGGEPDPIGVFPPSHVYRYENGQLLELGKSATGIESSAWVLGISDSGDTAYFVTVNNPESAPGRASVIYRWHLGEGVSEAFSLEELGTLDETPRNWSTSPNGRFAAFEALSLLAPDALPGPTCKAVDAAGQHTLVGRCYQVYVFDSATGQLSCASCSPFGEAPAGNSTVGSLFGAGPAALMLSRHTARGIAGDGTLYFDSPDRLTAGDGDGKRDVYEWRPGAVALLTPGTPTDAVYADASADGSTVFTLTASKLVSQDRDNNLDVYGIRRGGGLVAQNPSAPRSACEGEACQGDLGSTPSASRPGSKDLNVQAEKPVRKKPRFELSRRVRIQGSSGRLAVKATGAGTVMLKGKGLRPARHRFRQAGSAHLSLRLTSIARNRLHRSGTFHGSATVIFRAADGTKQTRRVVVEFIAGVGK